MGWKWKWSQESPPSRPKFVDVIACPAMLFLTVPFIVPSSPIRSLNCGHLQVVAMLPDPTLVPPIPLPLPERINDQPSSHPQGFLIFFAFKTDWAFLVSLIPCVALTTIIDPSSLLCPKCDRWRYCYTHCRLFLEHAHIAGDESYIVRHTPCSSHTQLRF